MDKNTKLTVMVRDRDRFWQLTDVDDWDAMTMVAAVSSDPRSFRELGMAWLRYRCESPLQDLPWQTWDQQTPAGQWLLIDLVCQRLVANTADDIPQERGGFQQTEGRSTPEMPVVWCNFPPWWERSIESNLDNVLPPIPEPVEPVDFRGILYGRAMAADLASRMLVIVAAEKVPEEHPSWNDGRWDLPLSDTQKQIASRWHELTIRVHADWLMTPRDDLDGQSPRSFLHRGREWVEWEIEYRQRQWSHHKKPPRALDRDTYAYRHGPMGRSEVVIYFDLCREVIHAGWKLLCQQPTDQQPTDQRQLTDHEQLSQALYAHAKDWLENGSIDGDPTPPADIIESGRRHMPLLADGTHLDCDCPLCRMMVDDAGMFYPAFSCFDGHHLELDDEFAFSLWETREQWEEEQQSYWEFNEEFERKEQQRKELATDDADFDPNSGETDDEFASVWTSSFVSDCQESRLRVSVLTLGFRMAELVGDLKTRQAAQEQVDALNVSFDSLSPAAHDSAERRSASAALSVELEKLATNWPDLTSKIADMQSQLDEWSRQAVDDELPF